MLTVGAFHLEEVVNDVCVRVSVCVSACVCVVCSTYDCTGMSWVKIRHQTCMDRVLSNNANTANILLSTGRRLLKCT